MNGDTETGVTIMRIKPHKYVRHGTCFIFIIRIFNNIINENYNLITFSDYVPLMLYYTLKSINICFTLVTKKATLKVLVSSC